MHDVGLLYKRLQRTTAGWIKRKRSLARSNQGADRASEWPLQLTHQWIDRPNLRNSDSRHSRIRAEQRDRSDHGELPLQHSAHGVHGDARKAHPADDIKETLDGQLGECGLSSEALHRSERLVLYSLLGLFNGLRIDLHLTHTNLGFKGPGVLIKQTADVTELILTSLHLCLERADFQRTGINKALHLVAIFAELHNALFE